jgi:hypothetical protein
MGFFFHLPLIKADYTNVYQQIHERDTMHHINNALCRCEKPWFMFSFAASHPFCTTETSLAYTYSTKTVFQQLSDDK